MDSYSMTRRTMRHVTVLAVLALTFGLVTVEAGADPHVGQSANVVIIGGTTLDTGDCAGFGPEANNMGWTAGGCLPVSGPSGELGDFTFAAMDPAAVDAAALASYDTAVLNMASTAMACDAANLSAQAKSDLVSFLGDGHKLIVYDSECTAQDYSWLPYMFTTANPGALGAPGTLSIIEENTLSTSAPADVHFIDAGYLGPFTDAVGDMNVMTTLDANWCLDMAGTNALNVTGPVHVYANYPSGTDDGLIVYNGLDQDFQGFGLNDPVLRKMWVQELQQPFNPSGLTCRVTVVGIGLTPETAENYVGDDHTVTATLTDLLGEPQEDIEVTFEVIAGPNVGVTGVATTDAAGEAAFTYAGTGGMGTDTIVASFENEAGEVIFSQEVEKIWVALPVPVDVKPTSCRNPFNVNKAGVLPVAILGTADFDATMVDPATVTLEGVAPLRWSVDDVATPYEPYLGKTDAFDCTEDGPDGFADLTLKFDALEVAAALGAVDDGDVLVLHVDGFLFDGATYIIGEDVIVVLEKK